MHRPSYASVTATLALVVALGGTGYAAAQLPRNSVGSAQIKTGAVKSADVKDGSLLAADFATGQLPAGAPGAQGAAGTPAAKYFAHILKTGATPSVDHGTAGITVANVGTGTSLVTFPAPVSVASCVFSITPDTTGAVGTVRKSSVLSSGSTVYVETSTGAGTNADFSYDIVAFC